MENIIPDKPLLSLAFADTFDNAKKFFTDILGQKYDLVFDNENPSYLIFGDSNFGETHWRYDSKATRKIFYTGERVQPNYVSHDYAMTFDHENSFRHYRLPLYVLEMWAMVNDAKYYTSIDDMIASWKKERDTLNIDGINHRPYFAAYVQTNPGCGPRNQFMSNLLTTGKKVACGGPHLNNVGGVLPRNDINHKLNFCRNAKFTVCYENGSMAGYVTEKILNAFCSLSVPIYWGSVTVDWDFNPESFVNRANFDSDQQLLEYLDYLDHNNDKYLEILSAPPLKNYLPNEWMNFDSFLKWFEENVRIK